MSPELLMTLIMFGGIFLLFSTGIPIAWAIGGVTIIVSFIFWGANSIHSAIAITYYGMMTQAYTAIPLFVFMGVLLERSGLAEDLFDMLYIWSGRLRGGLAMATIIICMVFAAMCGLTAAACVTMTIVALPAMLKRGYSKDIAIGSVLAPSTLGILIPPSVYMIILGVVGQISVGKLFIGGIVPGLVMTSLFIIYIGIKAWLQPQSCPAISESYSLRQKLICLREMILPILIIFSVLGTIMGGIATPSEAAGLGCIALVLSVAIRRRFTWKIMWETSLQCFKVTAFCMWIIFLATAFAAVYIGLGGIEFFEKILLGTGMSPWVSFVTIVVITFFLGTFMDPFAIIWVIVPITFPIMKSLGFDLVWYSIILVINFCTAYITPPYGNNIFYLQILAPPEVTIEDIYHSIWPFLTIMIVTIIIVSLFPQLVLWLPSMMITRG